jgi:hypothetical protein
MVLTCACVESVSQNVFGLMVWANCPNFSPVQAMVMTWEYRMWLKSSFTMEYADYHPKSRKAEPSSWCYRALVLDLWVRMCSDWWSEHTVQISVRSRQWLWRESIGCGWNRRLLWSTPTITPNREKLSLVHGVIVRLCRIWVLCCVGPSWEPIESVAPR